MSANIAISGLALEIDDRDILRDMDHIFDAGTTTLIIGRNGSGKTMLLELIAGVRAMTAGSIMVGDRSIRDGKKLVRETALELGVAFQHPEQQLFANTVEQEFRYTLRPYNLCNVDVVAAMERAIGNSFREDRDWLSENPFTLSGGEKRRLTHALLESTGCNWLLLDEPTAGLDHEGARLLVERLMIHQAGGGGAIITSHDPEKLLDIADRVVLLDDGRIVWQGTPKHLIEDPNPLATIGLPLPDKLRTMQVMSEAGFVLPACSSAEQVADILMGTMTSSTNHESSLSDRDYHPSAALSPVRYSSQLKLQLFQDAPSDRFDPRALWIAYMLITPGIWLQSSWVGWFVSLFIAFGMIWICRTRSRQWMKPAIALSVFMLAASVTAGLTWDDGVHLLWQPFIDTLFRFSKLVLIMLVGLSLMLGIKPLQLKRAMEQSLGGLVKVRVPIDKFAMTAALMTRFVPVLMTEWSRTEKSAAARGKYTARPGRVPIRSLKVLFIPYLMSLMRLGESLSVTLIARGVGQGQTKSTMSYRLSFHKVDWLLVAVGLIALGILLMINIFTFSGGK